MWLPVRCGGWSRRRSCRAAIPPNLAPITFAVSAAQIVRVLSAPSIKQGVTMTEEFWSGIRDNVCAWPPLEPAILGT